MFYSDMSNLRPVTAALSATDALWALRGFDLTLGQAARPNRHLRARCRCGRQGAVDIGYWLSRRLQWRALADFEDLVRCPCGERRVMLEIGVGPPCPGARFYVAP
jgi:hypothetical protein